eukprot:7386618-Prymnesium_polylepis.1
MYQLHRHQLQAAKAWQTCVTSVTRCARSRARHVRSSEAVAANAGGRQRSSHARRKNGKVSCPHLSLHPH